MLPIWQVPCGIFIGDLTQPFDCSFTVNLGCNTGLWTGADSMVFALQPISTSIGTAGGQMGLGGVIPSLGVFIDTCKMERTTTHIMIIFP